MNNIVCPVNCLYCMASKIECRSKFWESGERIGLNKSCVFINKLPSDPPLSKMNIPWDLFEGDYLGFQGITDCFWKKYIEDLKFVVKKVQDSQIKKLVLISKIPLSDEQLNIIKVLKDRLVVIYSITGLDNLEKTKTSDRLKAIKKLKENNIDVLPIVHPYIYKQNDLSSFEYLKKIGIEYVSWKGFRYNHKNMDSLKKYIPSDILNIYKINEEQEILYGEEILNQKANECGLKFVDLKAYIQKPNSISGVPLKKAIEDINKLIKIVVFSSSSKSRDDVVNYALKRRIK